MSVGVGGASVTQVAQRHEITRQQIHAWRHYRKKEGLCPKINTSSATGCSTKRCANSKQAETVCRCVERMVETGCERADRSEADLGGECMTAQYTTTKTIQFIPAVAGNSSTFAHAGSMSKGASCSAATSFRYSEPDI